MKLRLFAISLTTVTLLLSMLGCSKKDDATLISATGSYKLDNVTKNCKVVVYIRDAASNTQLTISLSTVPEPQNGPEVVQLFYTKLPGQPNTSYSLVSTTLVANNSAYVTVATSYATTRTLLTVGSNGLCRGTFGGASITFGNNSVISDGVFDNVTLQ